MDARQLHDLGQQLRVGAPGGPLPAAGMGARAIEAAARALAGEPVALR